MKEKKNKKKSTSDLNFENEFRKAKLQIEKGAHFQTNGKIPPELESIFLDHIEKFDKAYKKASPITIFEKIGNPKYKPVKDIPPGEIKKELLSLQKKLGRKGLMVESICKVEDSEMYRFITEELFSHEIDNISIKGMMTHFTYEEFHPNHEYDIINCTRDFIHEIFGGKQLEESYLLEKNIKTSSGKIISLKSTLEKINFFRSFYSKFEITLLEISNVIIQKNNKSAEAAFDLSYVATMEGSSEKQIFSGAGKTRLNRKVDFWKIASFEVPGLKF